MQHCMAIWADRNQVSFRIDHVFLPNAGERNDVMDMDETCADCSKGFFKIKSTHFADSSVVSDSFTTSPFVTLIGVRENLTDSTFNIGLVWENFIGKRLIIRFEYNLETGIPQDLEALRIESTREIIRSETATCNSLGRQSNNCLWRIPSSFVENVISG